MAACELCSGEFVPRSSGGTAQRFCSPRCARRSRQARELVERTCIMCGVKWRSRRSDARFCSVLCRDVWRLDQPTDPMFMAGGGRAQQRVCHLPNDHPARWVGRSCPVTFGPCAWCGIVICRGQSSLRAYCGRRCKRLARTRRRRAYENEQRGVWSWGEFMHVARRFGYRCAYCGEKPADQLQPDHVIPLSRGGPNVLSNILPACAPCNGSKSDKTLVEWDEYLFATGRPPRATSWAQDDSRYFHLTVLQAA